jgi:hypothetical protein
MSDKKSKVFKDLIAETIIDTIDEENIHKYIKKLKKIFKELKQFPCKLKLTFKCEFKKPIDSQPIETYYSHPIQIIKSKNNIADFFNDLTDGLDTWIDKFQEKGSGLVFNKILFTEVKIYKYKYLKASSYIPLQFKSSNIINVQNNDNKCFLWTILSKLAPAKDHIYRVSKYRKYENCLNMKDIEYPVSFKDIPKIEKQNNLSINVFALKNQSNKYSLYPVYISNYSSKIIIDMLYLENNKNTHYCLIKDLDSFLYDKNKHKQFTGRNCLQGFQRETTLENHKEICFNHKHYKTKMPKKKKTIFLNLLIITILKNFLLVFIVILKQIIFLFKHLNQMQMNLM